MKANSGEGASEGGPAGHRGPITGPAPVPWRRTVVASVLWAGCAGLPFAIVAPFIVTGHHPPDALLVVFLVPMIYAVPGVPLMLGSDLLPSWLGIPVLVAWCFLAWTGWIRLEHRSRIEAWVLFGAPFFVGLAFAVMAPGYFGAREKVRSGACDQAYIAPRDFLAGELAGIRAGGASPVCHATSADEALACFLRDRSEALNPRNRKMSAYVREVAAPCQVELRTVGPRRIEVRQQPVTGGVFRTFSIGVD